MVPRDRGLVSLSSSGSPFSAWAVAQWRMIGQPRRVLTLLRDI